MTVMVPVLHLSGNAITQTLTCGDARLNGACGEFDVNCRVTTELSVDLRRYSWSHRL